MTSESDVIRISELRLTLIVNDDEQAVLLSLTIPHDLASTAHSDNLALSVDYAAVHTSLVETLPTAHYPSLEALVDRVFETLFRAHSEVGEATVASTLRDASPRPTLESTRKRDQAGPWRFVLHHLALSLIVGVNPRERTEEQPVVLDITVDRPRRGSAPFPFSGLSSSILHTLAPSSYLTVEALISAVAYHVLEYTKDARDEVTIRMTKPKALALAAAQVQITRRREDFSDTFPTQGIAERPSPLASGPSVPLHSVALALGSNLGDRFAHIETALRLLELPSSLISDFTEDAHVAVVNTSFMYETAPMYVTDQPRFANCACMVETNLSPKNLLRLVKEVETVVGRVPGMRFGPRAVDVDILTYDEQLLDSRTLDSRATLDNLIGELVIPHPRMCEREFVLRPLNDMIPHFVHPAYNKTIRTLMDELMSTRSGDYSPMLRVLPFPKYPAHDAEVVQIGDIRVSPTAKYWTLFSTDPAKRGRPHKTRLMATLNMTPDSFSDGAQHNTLPAALAYTSSALSSGAEIIDIGGYSTRPGAPPVSPADELARVLPIIHAIRAHPSETVRRALLSVDTFRAEVAEAAVQAGANCINDVHAFTGPGYPLDDAALVHRAEMRGVARALGVPVVLMHSRGDAGRNKDYQAYDGWRGGIVGAVQTELGDKVDAVVRGPGGVRRWLVIVDPGIGFSKPVEAQLALMRDLGRVTAPGSALAGYPLLVGPSKKSVWGAVLEEGDVDGACEGRKTSAQERGWATAAAVACAVQQGASVVRVHDMAEMRDVVAVASAIWNR